MTIGGFQKVTLLDYPGQVACIVFLEGCNFRCPFCHNSGFVLPERRTEGLSEAEVLAYLEKRRGILDGVVVTGGEPLLAPDLPEFLKKVRRTGCKIKLDTNGSFPERLQALLSAGLVDYAAMDVKQTPEKYGLAAGISNPRISGRIQKSLQILRTSGVPFELRTTVIRGIHTKEDIAEIAKWISGAEPYYLQPFVKSENVLAPEGLGTFSREEMLEMQNLAAAYCPNTRIRG